MAQENYAYIIECSDGTFYSGWTNNLKKRMSAHNSGKGAKYTHSRYPVKLVYYETFDTKEEAMSREWHYKQLTRAKKIELINSLTDESVRISISEINKLVNEQIE